MIEARTAKGTMVWVSYIPDCGSNVGGFYVEIYLDEYGDRYDDFCIHPEDCDCADWDAVERFAREYVSRIEDY